MNMIELDIKNLKTSTEVSKKFENIKLKSLQEIPESHLKQDFKTFIEKEKIFKKNDCNKIHISENNNNEIPKKTQLNVFQSGMRVLFIYGLISGMNPVTGILQKDVVKIRFKIFSFKFLYSMMWIILQAIIFGLCLYRIFTVPLSLGTLMNITFYATVLCSATIFTKIASKWSILIKEVNNCRLEQYVEPKIIKNINLTCIVSLFLTILDITFRSLVRIAFLRDCGVLNLSVFEQMLRHFHPFLFNVGLQYNLPLGIVVQIVSVVLIINWVYVDVLIVCFSQYLTSILVQINKKVIWAADKTYLSSSIWSTLREDYTRATRLVKHFDDVFSGLILVSFANNLVFTHLGLFNMLANGLDKSMEKCVRYPSGLLKGYEYPIYWSYSMFLVLGRFLTVSLLTAGVNAASLEPAKALYRIPSCAYSKEAQRFLEQVHGDTVALSGWDFFYITRGLVLSIVATVITYELVLLQFNNDVLNNF